MCIYVYGICSHVQYLFPQFLPPHRSRGIHCPIHAAEITSRHQSHWWPRGCCQRYSPRRAACPLARTLLVLAFSPFLILRKEKGNLRRFLCQKPFSSIQSSRTVKFFAQRLPPGCCLLLAQPAPSSAAEWSQLCCWTQILITPLSFAPFHSRSPGSVEIGEVGMLMFLNLETYFPVKYTLCIRSNFNFSYRSQCQLKSLRFLLIAYFLFLFFFLHSTLKDLCYPLQKPCLSFLRWSMHLWNLCLQNLLGFVLYSQTFSAPCPEAGVNTRSAHQLALQQDI